jgi:hypothetical protein
MYSQLSSIAVGRPSIRNPRMRQAVVTRDPPNMARTVMYCDVLCMHCDVLCMYCDVLCMYEGYSESNLQ